MEIMFFYYSLAGGGAERVITSLSNILVSKGINVTIVVLENKKISYYVDQRIKIECIENYLGNREHKKTSWMKILRKVIRKRNPNVIIAFSLELTIIAKLASLFLPTRIIGSERSATKWSVASVSKKLLMLFVSKFSDGYIFLTKKGMEEYPSGIRKKATVITNAVYAESIPQIEVHSKNFGAHKIISVGRLIKGKDFVSLIKAFSLFHKEFPHYTLDIFGEGPEEGYLKKLAKSMQMDKFVHFKGFNGNIPLEMTKYSMFVFTSRGEGMPNVLIEALACGLPCISTDCDFGPSELIKDGINGILVPVGDIDRIKDAMIQIASNKEFAMSLSNAALRIRKTHSAERIYKQYYDYILEITK